MKSLCWFAGWFLMIMLISPVHASPGSYSGMTITRIEVKDDRGEPWPRPGQVLPLIVVKPGDRLAGSAVREGIATLYLKGIFKDIRVEAFPDDGGVRLEYVVTPITVVDTIAIHGNSAVSTSTILDMLASIQPLPVAAVVAAAEGRGEAIAAELPEHEFTVAVAVDGDEALRFAGLRQPES